MRALTAMQAQRPMPSAWLAAIVFIATGLFSGLAVAQNPEYLSSHRDWHTFQMVEDGTQVCFMATRPTDSRGNYTRRGEIGLFVTHRPGQNSWSVVSLHTGYTYQEGSSVSARIGSDSFTFFTAGEVAFAYEEDDARLIGDMRDGADVIIEGTSSRGTLTTDTFSLRGFTAAYEQISSICGSGSAGS